MDKRRAKRKHKTIDAMVLCCRSFVLNRTLFLLANEPKKLLSHKKPLSHTNRPNSKLNAIAIEIEIAIAKHLPANAADAIVFGDITT